MFVWLLGCHKQMYSYLSKQAFGDMALFIIHFAYGKSRICVSLNKPMYSIGPWSKVKKKRSYLVMYPVFFKVNVIVCDIYAYKCMVVLSTKAMVYTRKTKLIFYLDKLQVQGISVQMGKPAQCLVWQACQHPRQMRKKQIFNGNDRLIPNFKTWYLALFIHF